MALDLMKMDNNNPRWQSIMMMMKHTGDTRINL